MKVHLLFPDRDFDFDATLPPGHQDLIQDLELATLFAVMAKPYPSLIHSQYR